MSLYSQGLAAPTRVLPSAIVDRVNDFRDGSRLFISSGSRFYQVGLHGKRVSVGGPIGGLVDGVTNIILDVVHIILLVAGTVMLINAIRFH